MGSHPEGFGSENGCSVGGLIEELLRFGGRILGSSFDCVWYEVVMLKVVRSGGNE